MGEQKEFLTTGEAADFLTLKKNTLEIWRVKGGGPVYRQFGRAVRYHRDDLCAYAESSRKLNTSQTVENAA